MRGEPGKRRPVAAGGAARPVRTIAASVIACPSCPALPDDAILAALAVSGDSGKLVSRGCEPWSARPGRCRAGDRAW